MKATDKSIKVTQVQTELQPIVDSLKAGLGNRLVAIVLFGSRARGDANKDSDWDLLVIAYDLHKRFLKRYMNLKSMLPALERGSISLLAKTPQEFDSVLPPLYLDIALDGIILYDSNNFARKKLAYLKNLIQDKGLSRKKSARDFTWHWEDFPGSNWAIEWERR